MTTDFGEGTLSAAEGLVLQPDGKLVAAGRVGRPLAGVDFGMARYRRDGSLDRRFGDGGLVVTDVGGDSEDYATALVRQRDGKLVVAGYSFLPGRVDPDFSLARYNADGSLDATFGTGGTVVTDVRGLDYVAEVVVQADGKVVVGGVTIYLSPTGELAQDSALVRYDADGSLDPTFGNGGTVLTDISQYDDLGGLALQADGRLVAAGSTALAGPDQGLVVARYRRDGSLDASFDGDGIVVTTVAGVGGASTLIVQADGKLVAGGAGLSPDGNQPAFGLVRFNRDGSLDQGFGTGGAVVTDFAGFPSAMVLDLVEHADGRLTAAGNATSATGETSQFALASYRPDGTLDRRFGHAGRVLTRFAGELSLASALVVQHDDKLVAAGATYQADGTFSEFALARYHGRRPRS